MKQTIIKVLLIICLIFVLNVIQCAFFLTFLPAVAPIVTAIISVAIGWYADVIYTWLKNKFLVNKNERM